MKLILYTDGGARGNPGPAGAGAHLLDNEGNTVAELTQYLGETTNNQAEYRALLLALKKAQELGATEIEVRADSELMVRQLNGQYKVKNEALIPVYQEAKKYLLGFAKWTIKHIPREQNKQADLLANKAIDERV